MSLFLVMTLLAVGYTLFSIGVQRKLVDTKRLYEMQDILKAKSKELNELVKSKASEEVLMSKQKEISKLLFDNMKSSFKPMFAILPVFFVMYYVIFPAVFPAKATISLLSMTFGYGNYFILVTFAVGLVLSLGLMGYDKSKVAKAKVQQNAVLEV